MELTVNLGPRTYPIILDEHDAGSLSSRLKTLYPKSKFGLITNATIASQYKKLIKQWEGELDLVIHTMHDGEQYKTVETWHKIFDTLLQAKFERSSVIIAFGGGVVGDVAGFAAATFMRGIKFVQIPTTLLAMVDSSVGGKTGLDHPAGKNLIGAFHQPSLVWIDTTFLKTLSKREFSAGYAELFKYAFIGGKDMFNFVANSHDKMVEQDTTTLLEGIRRSIQIKANVVEQDEFETLGAQMLLNLGHTFGHALEKRFNFGHLRHGEAVWWGIRCAIELGKNVGTIPAYALQAYEEMVQKLDRPLLPFSPSSHDVYEAMFFDKKVTGGGLKFVLPTDPGSSVVKSGIPEEMVKKVIDEVFKE